MNNVVEIEQISVWHMIVKLVIGKNFVNVIVCLSTTDWYNAEEKDNFCNAVYDLMVDLKKHQIVVFGGDLNWHVGKSSDSYGVVHKGLGEGKKTLMMKGFWSWVMQWRYCMWNAI